jgi:SAM-dependent methyltransferase
MDSLVAFDRVTRLGVMGADLAGFYDARYGQSYMETHPPLEEWRVRHLLALMPRTPRRILDYGCGRGGWIPFLSKIFPDAEIVGVDISRRALERARERFPAPTFRLIEGGAAPIKNEAFDLVFSYHVLEHVSDLEETVADMARAARRTGYLCVMVPCANEGSFEERVVRSVRDGLEPSVDGMSRFFFDDAGHIRRPTSGELLASFERHGVAAVEQMFAGQRWGAVEWLTTAGPDSVKELFDPGRARTRRDAAKLATLRWAFLLLASLARVERVRSPLRTALAGGLPPSRRALLAAAAPLKLLAFPTAATLRSLARVEWRRSSHRQNGSALYLLLRKQPVLAGSAASAGTRGPGPTAELGRKDLRSQEGAA